MTAACTTKRGSFKALIDAIQDGSAEDTIVTAATKAVRERFKIKSIHHTEEKVHDENRQNDQPKYHASLGLPDTFPSLLNISGARARYSEIARLAGFSLMPDCRQPTHAGRSGSGAL